MFNTRNAAALNTNRKAQRVLRNAFLHLDPYDADAARLISRAMDRVDNERRRLLPGRRRPVLIITEAR